MARAINININRFDQGMNGDIRDTSNPLKFAYIQHLDIYRKTSEAHVMPGFVSDNAFDGSATGLKARDVRAITYVSGQIIAVGTKADTTGSALFYKNAPTDAEWDEGLSGTAIEGTDDLADRTWLAGTTNSNLHFITTAGTATYVSRASGGSVTDKVATIIAALPTLSKKLIAERSFLDSDIIYVNYGGSRDDIGSINGATFTLAAKTTDAIIDDIQSGNETIGLGGSLNFPSRTQLLLWDSASLLLDQKINNGGGRTAAVGYPSGFWVAVVNEGVDPNVSGLNEQVNGDASFSIKAATGVTSETLYRTTAPTSTNGEIIPVRGTLRDSMVFYARIPKDATPTAYYEGVWAVGKSSLTSPLAVSIPFDTSSLGEVDSICNFGNNYYFIHGGDGSVSRLDAFETGTYDIPATLETLFYGSDTPYLKSLKGMSVLTENLPSGGSVQVQYRTDQDSSWTTLATSSTAGTQKHDFTRAAGVPIGRFHEIQFKIILTGKIVIKGIRIALEETDTLSY